MVHFHHSFYSAGINQIYLESFEMWCWRNWTDYMRDDADHKTKKRGISCIK